MATSQEQANALQKAASEYIKKERARLTNEASVLKAVLARRGTGAGLSEKATQAASSSAQQDMDAYLSER